VKYYFVPLGCAKNQVDAEIMMAHLNRGGWVSCEKPSAADLIIINSCGFIESAKQESINTVLGCRKDYPDKKILLAGCLAERYEKELRETLPEADGFFGIGDLSKIDEAARSVAGARKAARKLMRKAPAGNETETTGDAGIRPLLSLPGQAYVKIAEGCDNHCTFCAIPLIRGRQRSRTVADILAESSRLLERGVRELCLIAQDTASFGMDRQTMPQTPELPALLRGFSALSGDFWVRLLYLHPDHFPLEILPVIAGDRRLLPYFDIPFQHGSEKILRLMGRRGNAASYLALIEKIREALPGAVIRSTFLTGFPGETDEDFAALLAFQEAAALDWAGVFTYSREEGTPAYSYPGRPSKKTARERKRLLEERQVPLTEGRMERFLGRTLDALVEEVTDAEAGLYLGRLYCHAPEVDAQVVLRSNTPLSPGCFVPCTVTARANFDLLARPQAASFSAAMNGDAS
jgi:ribosomal protein S12 methylthiotransferase